VLKILEIWKGNPSQEIDLDLGENDGSTSYSVGDEIIAFPQRGETDTVRKRESDAAFFGVLRSMLEEQPQAVENDPDFRNPERKSRRSAGSRRWPSTPSNDG
jgi:hypothetical protein